MRHVFHERRRCVRCDARVRVGEYLTHWPAMYWGLSLFYCDECWAVVRPRWEKAKAMDDQVRAQCEALKREAERHADTST